MADRLKLRQHTWMDVAYAISGLATCARRKVGCVMLDSHHRVLATGYNGVARGQSHCSSGTPCPGATCAPGTGLDLCEAIHAEVNALVQLTRPDDVHTIYVTASPCVHCVKPLLNTAGRVLIFHETYAHGDAALNLWRTAGRSVRHLADYVPRTIHD